MKNNILYIIEAAALITLVSAGCLEYTGEATITSGILGIIAGIWLLLYWAVNWNFFGREFDHGYDEEEYDI